MAIASKYRGGGSFIKTPGEYVVEVEEIKSGKSKKNQSMLTVVFKNDNDEKIAGYYVRDLKFHMAALTDLKVACGLKHDTPADELIGKKCGILVEAGDTDEKGRTFMQVTGYGRPQDVTMLGNSYNQTSDQAEDLPF